MKRYYWRLCYLCLVGAENYYVDTAWGDPRMWLFGFEGRGMTIQGYRPAIRSALCDPCFNQRHS